MASEINAVDCVGVCKWLKLSQYSDAPTRVASCTTRSSRIYPNEAIVQVDAEDGVQQRPSCPENQQEIILVVHLYLRFVHNPKTRKSESP